MIHGRVRHRAARVLRAVGRVTAPRIHSAGRACHWPAWPGALDPGLAVPAGAAAPLPALDCAHTCSPWLEQLLRTHFAPVARVIAAAAAAVWRAWQQPLSRTPRMTAPQLMRASPHWLAA